MTPIPSAPPLECTIGQIGFKIRRNLPLDLSTRTTPVVTIEAEKPDGTVASLATTLLPDPSEGHGTAEFTSTSGDLDQAGLWVCREKMVDGASETWFSPNVFHLHVKAVYEP